MKMQTDAIYTSLTSGIRTVITQHRLLTFRIYLKSLHTSMLRHNKTLHKLNMLLDKFTVALMPLIHLRPFYHSKISGSDVSSLYNNLRSYCKASNNYHYHCQSEVLTSFSSTWYACSCWGLRQEPKVQQLRQSCLLYFQFTIEGRPHKILVTLKTT